MVNNFKPGMKFKENQVVRVTKGEHAGSIGRVIYVRPDGNQFKIQRIPTPHRPVDDRIEVISNRLELFELTPGLVRVERPNRKNRYGVLVEVCGDVGHVLFYKNSTDLTLNKRVTKESKYFIHRASIVEAKINQKQTLIAQA